jgi:hypothetical protein
MKKLFTLILASVFALAGISQTITDTTKLRTAINTYIVANNNKEINAAQLNRILNGVINVLPNTGGGTAGVTSFKGRFGPVLPAYNDYTVAMISGLVSELNKRVDTVWTNADTLYYTHGGVTIKDKIAYLETDPIYGASAAAGVTSTLISHWNTAYDRSLSANPVFSSGIITFTKQDGNTLTVNLDGRYNKISDTAAMLLPYVLKGGSTMTGYLTLVGDPVNANHAVNKNYVDNLVTGLTWKQAVKAATTANITLSGEQTIDGVALVTGDRVLVKNQTTATANGVYVVASGSWTRASDADASSEVLGLAVYVNPNGVPNTNTYGGTQWANSNSSVTLGSTNITFSQIAGAGTYTNGAGINLTSNVFSTDNSYIKGLFSTNYTQPLSYNATTGVFSFDTTTTSGGWHSWNWIKAQTDILYGETASANTWSGIQTISAAGTPLTINSTDATAIKEIFQHNGTQVAKFGIDGSGQWTFYGSTAGNVSLMTISATSIVAATQFQASAIVSAPSIKWTSGTNGRVMYSSGSSGSQVFGDNGNFKFDVTTTELRIGSQANPNADWAGAIYGTTSGTAASANFNIGPVGILPMRFVVTDAHTEAGRLHTSGNWNFGANVADAGYLVRINGTELVTGAVSFSSTLDVTGNAAFTASVRAARFLTTSAGSDVVIMGSGAQVGLNAETADFNVYLYNNKDFSVYTNGANKRFWVSGATVNVTGTFTASSTITGSSFSGAGTGLTGTAASLTAGQVTNGAYVNAANIFTSNNKFTSDVTFEQTNPVLILNRTSSGGAARIDLKTNGTANWSAGVGVSSINNNYEVYNASLAANAVSYNYTTNAAVFGGSISTSSSVNAANGNFSALVSMNFLGNAWAAGGAGTNYSFGSFGNSGGSGFIGVERSTANGLTIGTTAYSLVLGTSTNTPVQIASNNVVRTTLSADGTTFTNTAASSVFVANRTTVGSGSPSGFKIQNSGTDAWGVGNSFAATGTTPFQIYNFGNSTVAL